MKYVKFNDLEGKQIESVSMHNQCELNFKCKDGSEYSMYHDQDCCEYVRIEDITEGWAATLTDAKVEHAYESSNSNNDPLYPDLEDSESFTWTFYRLITDKGTVVIRWLGQSNGYYSEAVSFTQTKEAK